LYCSSVFCLYLDVFIGGFWWGMTLGVGKAMLMRGGACATELCLMMGWVCVIVSNWCGLPACELWRCGFRFLALSAFCSLCGLNLYGFGAGSIIYIG
jgi:hypothetical protein